MENIVYRENLDKYAIHSLFGSFVFLFAFIVSLLLKETVVWWFRAIALLLTVRYGYYSLYFFKYDLTITDRRIIIKGVFTKREFLLKDIKYKRYKFFSYALFTPLKTIVIENDTHELKFCTQGNVLKKILEPFGKEL